MTPLTRIVAPEGGTNIEEPHLLIAGLHDGPKRPSRAPKKPPRGPQERPKRPQDGPRTAPDAAQTAPRGPRDDSSGPRGLQEPFWLKAAGQDSFAWQRREPRRASDARLSTYHLLHPLRGQLRFHPSPFFSNT